MSQFISSRTATSVDWQRHFTALADAIGRLQQGGETTLSSFAGEQSDFIRFNSGKVRQTGSVSQGKLTLRLIDGARQAYSTLTVCGDLQQDLDEVSAALVTLREGAARRGGRSASAVRHVEMGANHAAFRQAAGP